MKRAVNVNFKKILGGWNARLSRCGTNFPDSFVPFAAIARHVKNVALPFYFRFRSGISPKCNTSHTGTAKSTMAIT